MLPHSRSMVLHRHLTPKACWLWGDKQQNQQPAAPTPQPASRPPALPPSPPFTAPPAMAEPSSPVVVRALAEQQPAAEVDVVVMQPQPQDVVTQAPAAVPATPIRAAANRSLFDVLKFNGPGPELINGRLAMLGFLAVAQGEVHTGNTVLQQALTTPVWVYAGLLLWVYASLVPMLKGARHEAFGIFTPQAEVLNGRAAMLGFGILLALEYKAGVPFF